MSGYRLADNARYDSCSAHFYITMKTGEYMNQRRFFDILALVGIVVLVVIMVKITAKQHAESNADLTAEVLRLTPNPTSAIDATQEVVEVSHLGEIDYADSPNQILVYPALNASLTLADYNQGRVVFDWRVQKNQPYSICAFVEAITHIICLPPQLIQTPDLSTPQICNYLADDWSYKDLRPYLQMSVDGEIIEASVQDRAYDRLSLCYRVPLVPGVHTMRYEFTLPEAEVHDVAEWSFTITP
jgi:hypothetical protein